jgi:hypothetical protein
VLAVTVLFKDLHPQPIPLHPGSSKSLFHSVFHFQAALNRTKDWSWPSDATPKSLDHWLVLNAGQGAGTRQLWRPEEKVADGWYNIRVSLHVRTPQLFVLQPRSMSLHPLQTEAGAEKQTGVTLFLKHNPKH